jgi:hypothetical protein
MQPRLKPIAKHVAPQPQKEAGQFVSERIADAAGIDDPEPRHGDQHCPKHVRGVCRPVETPGGQMQFDAKSRCATDPDDHRRPAAAQVARDLALQRHVRAAAKAVGEVDRQPAPRPNPAQAIASANRGVRSGSFRRKSCTSAS